MKNVAILGATGSIGLNTLAVMSLHPEKYNVFALTANNSWREMEKLCIKHMPKFVVMANEEAAESLRKVVPEGVIVLQGEGALNDIASHKNTDFVMAAIVGSAGLSSTFAAVTSGKRVMLANKESLVLGGNLLVAAAKESGAELIPVDSEHSAIFQCLQGGKQGLNKIQLTASGGPFLKTPIAELNKATPKQACAHPKWKMGQKISVDSATMMNKGLEFIEAKWLFGLESSDIQVVLHPQSIIHSMVQYIDGSVLAQMGNPDMRTPIAHALAFPYRVESGVSPLDFNELSNFTFTEPEAERYPNLILAMEASSAGQYATTTLNAANEVAVDAFLQGKINFIQIAQVNEECLQQTSPHNLNTIEAVIESDNSARRLSLNIIGSRSQPSIQRVWS